MREEAAEVRDTLPDIESWAEKLQLLAEEVHSCLWQTTLTCAPMCQPFAIRHGPILEELRCLHLIANNTHGLERYNNTLAGT